MLPRASRSPKSVGLLDALDGLDGMDVATGVATAKSGRALGFGARVDVWSQRNRLRQTVQTRPGRRDISTRPGRCLRRRRRCGAWASERPLNARLLSALPCRGSIRTWPSTPAARARTSCASVRAATSEIACGVTVRKGRDPSVRCCSRRLGASRRFHRASGFRASCTVAPRSPGAAGSSGRAPMQRRSSGCSRCSDWRSSAARRSCRPSQRWRTSFRSGRRTRDGKTRSRRLRDALWFAAACSEQDAREAARHVA